MRDKKLNHSFLVGSISYNNFALFGGLGELNGLPIKIDEAIPHGSEAGEAIEFAISLNRYLNISGTLYAIL